MKNLKEEKCLIAYRPKSDISVHYLTEPMTEEQAKERVLRLWENLEVRRESIQVLYVDKILKGLVEQKVIFEEYEKHPKEVSGDSERH